MFLVRQHLALALVLASMCVLAGCSDGVEVGSSCGSSAKGDSCAKTADCQCGMVCRDQVCGDGDSGGGSSSPVPSDTGSDDEFEDDVQGKADGAKPVPDGTYRSASPSGEMLAVLTVVGSKFHSVDAAGSSKMGRCTYTKTGSATYITLTTDEILGTWIYDYNSVLGLRMRKANSSDTYYMELGAPECIPDVDCSLAECSGVSTCP